MLSTNESYRVTKKTEEIIRTNRDKKVKWKYKVNNKLIVFTYYLSCC